LQFELLYENFHAVLEDHVPLTLWKPGYDIFVLWNQAKTSSCRLPYQRHSSSADCSTELLKGSNRSTSHLACTGKKFFLTGNFFWVTS